MGKIDPKDEELYLSEAKHPRMEADRGEER